ncbi:MAG TPA: alanine racemase, partial [Desulfomonilia bacterium]|nr:alanine racemase [Desulfomonilia bacterium]
MRPTRVEIDLSAIKHNIELIRARTKGRVMMAIKADAYGHGAKTVGRFVQERSLVDMLGVSCIEEGIQLREAGVRLPILNFGLITPSQDDIEAVFSHDLTPTLVDISTAEVLVQGARRWNRTIGVHVKTDTGMGRLGLTPEKTLKVIEHISSLREITISGIYTHFPVSDVPGSKFTESQIRRFIEFSNRLATMKINVGLRHC